MLFKASCTVRVRITGTPDLPEPERKKLLETHLDDVMDALLSLEDATDPDISVDFGTGEVLFELVVDAENEREANRKADAIARSAVHAAGGFTASWWSLDWQDGEDRGAHQLAEA